MRFPRIRLVCRGLGTKRVFSEEVEFIVPVLITTP